MAGRGMDGYPGRLVDDEQLIVFVDESEVDCLSLERRQLSLDQHLHGLAAPQAVALCFRLPVDANRIAPKQPFGRRAGSNTIELGEKPIEPHSCSTSRDAYCETLALLHHKPEF